MSLSLDVTLSIGSEKPGNIWSALRRSHPGLLADTAVCKFGDTECLIKDGARLISRSGKPHFGLHIAGGQIHFSDVTHFDHSLVWIDGLVLNFDDAEKWVTPFLEIDGFFQAWVYDPEYNRWQNAEDPLIYEAHRRSITGLSMKSNKLPFPLEKEIIDISSNPGRRICRKGYVESVAAVMWFSTGVLDKLNISHSKLSKLDWATTDWISDHIVRIQISEKPFTSADNEAGRLQDRLRSVLY